MSDQCRKHKEAEMINTKVRSLSVDTQSCRMTTSSSRSRSRWSKSSRKKMKENKILKKDEGYLSENQRPLHQRLQVTKHSKLLNHFKFKKWTLCESVIVYQLLLQLLTTSVYCAPLPATPSRTSALSSTSASSSSSLSFSTFSGESDVQATQAAASCISLEPPFLKTEDKIVLAPIVFQGQLMAKSNVYNSMYFVSFRIQKVWKGRLPRKIHRHVRLLFHSDSTSSGSAASSSTSGRRLVLPQDQQLLLQHLDGDDDDEEQGDHELLRRRRAPPPASPCSPVRFNVQAGKKYLIYMKKIAHGRYLPVALPDDYNKKTRKLAKALTCAKCTSPPKVSELRSMLTVSEGTEIKLKCKVAGSPTPEVTWLKNGHPIRPNFRFSVKTKKKRSQLRVTDVSRRDIGKYTCSAKNALGEDSQTSSIIVRYSVPEPPPSACPIEGFCLNDGKCFYYEVIGELVCKCTEGFAGQRCQFKKARIDLPFVEGEACGPYGHDIHLREICAAWKRPPVTEMTKEEYDAWLRVEQQLVEIRRQKEIEQMRKFREMTKGSHSATNSSFGLNIGDDISDTLPWIPGQDEDDEEDEI